MANYEVIYRVEVNATDPKNAALYIEGILKHPIYRPSLEVIDKDGNKTNFDLEDEDIDE